jgi:hypothetical protein
MPDQPDLYQNRAIVLTDLGRNREATQDLNAALMLDPPQEEKLVLEKRLQAILQTDLPESRPADA